MQLAAVLTRCGQPEIEGAMWKVWLIIGVAVSLVGALVAIEYRVWKECRSDHSWFYCVRVMG
ncbi:hypothetical protein [Burkholderia gladioli]|uniref:hypothetical protein n=1 Tax=Burkholderia gladioli TaxID=28095 RepID=UPI00163E2731|nr:hypothetical protein [Burkholderia gladioli]